MKNQQDGYDEAAFVDKWINKVLARYPITKKTAVAWSIFARTIKSTCDIIETEAIQLMIDQGEGQHETTPGKRGGCNRDLVDG